MPRRGRVRRAPGPPARGGWSPEALGSRSMSCARSALPTRAAGQWATDRRAALGRARRPRSQRGTSEGSLRRSSRPRSRCADCGRPCPMPGPRSRSGSRQAHLDWRRAWAGRPACRRSSPRRGTCRMAERRDRSSHGWPGAAPCLREAPPGPGRSRRCRSPRAGRHGAGSACSRRHRDEVSSDRRRHGNGPASHRRR